MQGLALRTWPADAVHDTVAAVLRTAPFQRDLRTTLLARLLRWLGDAVAWLAGALHGMPGGRSAVIWVTALVCALVVARVLFAARARDPDAAGGRVARSIGRARDPWRTAEALAASGDHEGAAHALYRAALESLAQYDRLRLHTSKTSGDYARELRTRQSGAYLPFRAFARRFEDAVYGHATIDATVTADLLRLAGALRARAQAA